MRLSDQEARDAAVLADGFDAQAWRAFAPVLAPDVSVRATMTSATEQGQLLAGRYRLLELVAFGGAGWVWRAKDLVLERLVAVKLLRPDVADEPLAAARFLAEARNASRLSHPCIAQVYDYGVTGPADLPFLVMELVDGPSLA
jgi:serine/threonine-protein kinase